MAAVRKISLNLNDAAGPNRVPSTTSPEIKDVEKIMAPPETKEEILDQYDVFVGSSATKYGDILARHDEF